MNASEASGEASATRRGRRAIGRVRLTNPMRSGWWGLSIGLVLLLVAGLLLALPLPAIEPEPPSPARVAAASAVQALDGGDMDSLTKNLAANVGNPEFAYFFTSQASPRLLGDAVATIAGRGTVDTANLETAAYETALLDLAGTVALASHGTSDRALPDSWTTSFIEATTTPETPRGSRDQTSRESDKRRAHQDEANKQNLLLLLSRGYWSTGFLQQVTKAYWDFAHRAGNGSWPNTAAGDRRYAPAPNGQYLTDGMLALSAALTANPAASKWAFTDFQPGNRTIEGSDYAIGNFTHYLVFEHRFPTAPSGEPVGMTTALTALSSAITALIGDPERQPAPSASTPPPDSGPMHDSVVLKAVAGDLANDGGCSWNPRDYWNCAEVVAEAVWRWIKRWGPLVLEILSLSTFAPPPFSVVGIAAAATSATWHAIEGDYGLAGLSLAAAVPGLAFPKIAKGVKEAVAAKNGATAASRIEKAADKSAEVAKRARAWRPKPWKDCGAAVPPGGLSLRYMDNWTKAQRRAADEKLKALSRAAQRGELKKTIPTKRSGTSASARYRQTGEPIPDGADVDHVIDLQLGGSDDISNLKPLDSSVNKSLGVQIAHQLRALPEGQTILAAAIC